MRRRTGTIQKRGDSSWRIRYVDLNGQRQQETIHGSRERAEGELAKRVGDIARGLPVTPKPSLVTFGELTGDVVSDYRLNRHRSVDDIEARFRLHIDPVFGKHRAIAINAGHLRAYAVRRRDTEKASAGTVNRELEAIRRAFKLAIRDGKIFTMPAVPRLREDNVRKGFLTAAEVARLCSHLKPVLAAIVRFGFLTGWRRDEIRNLKWANVDFDAGEIRLDPGTTKNGEGRVFPMSAELRVLLESQKPARGTAFVPVYVFVIKGRPVGEFRKQWLRACHKAGLPCVVGQDGKPIRALRLFHDLRRSAAREFVRTQGLSEREAMMLTGHKTRVVFDRYSIVSTADLEGIREKLDGKRAKDRASGGSMGG